MKAITIAHAANKVLRLLDLRLSRESLFISPQQFDTLKRDLKLAEIRLESIENAAKTVQHLAPDAGLLTEGYRWVSKSRSQLGQDLFALLYSGFKKDGFFIEVGATDGITLSNSFLLEKYFGWTGILVEPEQSWHPLLRKNRDSVIDSRAIWSESGRELEFVTDGVLSSLVARSNRDMHSRSGPVSLVQTVSLTDLLVQHNCPKQIDYLSIDIEGSELDLLQNFPGPEFRIRCISIEHNYSASRTQIYETLTRSGYTQVGREVSKFDDFYVLESELKGSP